MQQSPEELLERATGWQAPITHLVDWVQARPATVTCPNSKRPRNSARLRFIEDGWTVDFSYNEQCQFAKPFDFKTST